MIKKIFERPYKEYLYCDDCNEKMIWMGKEYDGNGVYFHHKCPDCNRVIPGEHKYPRIQIEEIEIED